MERIFILWLSGNSLPDFRTINYFRGKRLRSEIHHLFSEVVRLLVSLDYVSLDVQYIDGTKIESRANRYTFVWRKSVEKHKAKLEAKIASVLADIEDQIKTDGKECNKEELKAIDSELLKKKLSELNAGLNDRNKASRKAIDKLQLEHLPRLEGYEKQLEILGDRNSFSKTDTDAVFMRMKDDHMKNGQLKPGYNAQISTQEQFITHYTIHQTTADTTTLETHLESFQTAYGQQSSEVVADAGYGSEQNSLCLRQSKSMAMSSTITFMPNRRKVKNGPFAVANLFYNEQEDFYVCPSGQRMNKTGTGLRTSANGHQSEVTYYKAQRCEGCPLQRSMPQGKGKQKHRGQAPAQQAQATSQRAA